MKKLFVIICAILGFNLIAKADQMYTVTVTIQVEYRYYSNGSLVSEESGTWESQVIDVCASSPEDAREQAKIQCDRMCRGEQHMGKKTIGDKQCDKYKVRRVYDASAKAKPGQFC